MSEAQIREAQAAEMEKSLKSVAFDGSSDLLLIATINTFGSSETIFVRSFEDSKDEYSFDSGSKLFYIQPLGTLAFVIRGGTEIQGDIFVNDGQDHVIALRYLK